MAETKSTNKERLREITAGIEDGIKELFESEKYMQYLRTMSRFHRYSVNNQMLINMQRPDATAVAGFNKWRDQFGRSVKKGEKGIKIIAPTPFKKKIEEMKLDPDTKAPVLDKDGNAVMEEKEIQIPMFKVVTVFDVSQTVGKPLPQLASDLAGNVQQYEVFMEALRRSSPVPMETRPILEDMDGFFSPDEQSITIRAGMSEVQTVSAAVHEIAHAKLHNYEKERAAAAAGDENAQPVKKKDRRTEEVEAESISYAVCQYYGIQTGENSFGYIASWSKGKELPELRSSLEVINKTASGLISDIDRHFAAICKERGIDPKAQEETERAASEPVAEQPTTEQEAQEQLLLVDEDKYLHIQPCEGGYDYTIYNKETMRELDGGRLDEPDIPISTAYLKICALHDMGGKSMEYVSLDILDEINEAIDRRQERDTAGWEQQNPPQPGHETWSELAGADNAPDTPGVPSDDAAAYLPEQALDEPDAPDPTITVPMMEHYGYTDSDMLPLSKDRAMELAERDITIYLLHNDNTEEMALDIQDIVEHEGIFGITREEWEAVRADIPLRDVEKRFLDSPTDAFAIYQLNETAPAELRFTRFEQLTQPPDRGNYEAVYTRELYPGDDVQTNLENIFHIFNEDRPMDFTGHSLSVSDIVALKRDGEISYHYCDWIGFQELPTFQKPDNHLKNAEMMLEDDYGMIDGIINNGPKEPTVAELEAQVKAGQQISLLDLANAVHRERREKKPSVLDQLKKHQPPQERKKTAPKKGAEREI